MLLFQMLSGKNPYENLSASEIKTKIRYEALPEVTAYYPLVSEEMRKIIKKATAKSPAERYQSCEAFKEAILQLKTATHTPAQDYDTIRREEDEEVVFINVPLYTLIALLIILGIMVFRYSLPRSSAGSDIVFDIKNTERIEEIQDSIAQAQQAQEMEDSLRVFQTVLRSQDSSEIFLHKVQRGETLAKIATRYRMPLDSLKKLNNLSGQERLRPREGIKVWVRSIYKLRRDENLADVSKKFGVSTEILREVNQLYPKSPEPGELPVPVIYEGKDLVIPA
ncbi:MAG: LysM peptidoglycan-binding domain-containing protein [Bacteroidia bacterium]|nr:LysM peptidoglycan-binding domain-containing protein [Bacteroidia bacterium]